MLLNCLNVCVNPGNYITLLISFMQPFFPSHPPPPPAVSSIKGSGFTKPQLEYYDYKCHLLDLETGQTSVDVVDSSDKEHSISSGSLFKETRSEVSALPYRPHVPIADQLGKESNNSSSKSPAITQMLFHPGRPSSMSIDSPSHIPPVGVISPPPLPTSPPFNLSLPPQSTAGKYGKRGAAGTVQFAGMSYTKSAREQAEAVTKERTMTAATGGMVGEEIIKEDVEDQCDLTRGGTEERNEISTASLSSEDRMNLMMEISTLGQTTLKRTNHPRSPGGTPLNISSYGSHRSMILTMSSNEHQQHNHSDLLQRALLAKFSSLYSTPFWQRRSFQQHDISNSFDFSNAWSDITSSIQIHDDSSHNAGKSSSRKR